VARQAARFTAVVVLPTPPFWFATAMIRAKYSPESENLAKASQGCKMFHVEHCCFDGENQVSEGELFHVEHCGTFAIAPSRWTRLELLHLGRCPAISQLRSSTMRLVSLRRRLVCAFLDFERLGGGIPRLKSRGGHQLLGDSRWSALFHVEHRSARAANGCESGESLKEIAETLSSKAM
jgi:hypothetical protein